MKLTPEQEQFLKDIIAVRSVGSDPEPGAPYGAKNREVLEVFLQKARELGFSTNVFNDKVGYLDYGDGDEVLAVVCHLDVVPEGEGWETPPFELTLKDGYYCGRGIVDDKGPACAAFFAIQKIKEEGLKFDKRIRLILGTDEERTCDCMHEYVTNPDTIIPALGFTPDAEFPAIFAEKGILQAVFKGPGVKDITVEGGSAANMVPARCTGVINGQPGEMRGKPAHASKPGLGINAIKKFVCAYPLYIESFRFITHYFVENNIVEMTGCNMEDLSGSLTANLGLIKVDESSQEFTVDIRYPATYSFEKLTECLTEAASKYGLTVDFSSHHMPPVVFEKDAPLIKALMKSWNNNRERFTGYKPSHASYNEAIAIGGGTYARHVPNIVAFGPQTPWSTDMCHQANERMSVNDFEVLIDLIYEALTDLG